MRVGTQLLREEPAPPERGRTAGICGHLAKQWRPFARNPEMGRRIGWGLATGGEMTSPTGWQVTHLTPNSFQYRTTVARNDMYADGVVADAKPKFLVHLRTDLKRHRRCRHFQPLLCRIRVKDCDVPSNNGSKARGFFATLNKRSAYVHATLSHVLMGLIAS